jgi:opacity protein-like surface antigen
MKKFVLSLLLLFAAAAAVFAQEEVQTQKQRKFFVALGFIDTIIGENFPGGTLSLGYHASPKSLFTTEINAGFYNDGKIASYSYGPPPYFNWYNDGEISYTYTAVEFLVSWYYVGKISEKFQFRAGPSAGVLVITGSDSYDPTSKDGHTIDVPDSTSETKATVTAGAGAGFIWNFHKRWFLDFGYRIMVNPGIKFDEQTLDILGTPVKVKEKKFAMIENQFNLTAGWRF